MQYSFIIKYTYVSVFERGIIKEKGMKSEIFFVRPLFIIAI